MSKLLELVKYIYSKYPRVEELSKTRLVKMVYLVDWKYTLLTGHQFTNIKWYFNHYGPYVEDVMAMIKNEPSTFKVDSYVNPYGSISDKISVVSQYDIDLDDIAKVSADFIIGNTSKMNWDQFISLVYSTFPIKNSSKYTYLNLDLDAKIFKSKSKEA